MMTLIEEYKNQNKWRQWERYLEKLPLNKNQTVYDLGCSVGFVTNLLSKSVKKVVGFDNDKILLEEAIKEKQGDCEFILENIFTLDPIKLEKCDGIWMSFCLAYMEDPRLFVSNWTRCLNHGGWFAIVDIDGLFSSHLRTDNIYFNKIESFEKESKQSKIYDFRIGSKIKNIMEECGLKVIVEEEDFYDEELNFKGSAEEDVIKNWKARLDRMIKLKEYFGESYSDFCTDFIETISDENHITNGGVKFYVGVLV
ncbi:MAG: class I SAM-dependent methyltransferase [Clostridiaceae bacterium]